MGGKGRRRVRSIFPLQTDPLTPPFSSRKQRLEIYTKKGGRALPDQMVLANLLYFHTVQPDTNELKSFPVINIYIDFFFQKKSHSSLLVGWGNPFFLSFLLFLFPSRLKCIPKYTSTSHTKCFTNFLPIQISLTCVMRFSKKVITQFEIMGMKKWSNVPAAEGRSGKYRYMGPLSPFFPDQTDLLLLLHIPPRLRLFPKCAKWKLDTNKKRTVGLRFVGEFRKGTCMGYSSMPRNRTCINFIYIRLKDLFPLENVKILTVATSRFPF